MYIISNNSIGSVLVNEFEILPHQNIEVLELTTQMDSLISQGILRCGVKVRELIEEAKPKIVVNLESKPVNTSPVEELGSEEAVQEYRYKNKRGR